MLFVMCYSLFIISFIIYLILLSIVQQETCYQYWPADYETFSVVCESESENKGFIQRKMTITSKDQVINMTMVKWLTLDD